MSKKTPARRSPLSRNDPESMPKNLVEALKHLSRAAALTARSIVKRPDRESFSAHNYAEAVELAERARTHIERGFCIIRGWEKRARFREAKELHR